ncbi:DUF1501 domain-containing protein, partial [Akkermansiaceae bacterium]|nr:DUF1501 domain-containing protein [Akkermansiaceae bacterium]
PAPSARQKRKISASGSKKTLSIRSTGLSRYSSAPLFQKVELALSAHSYGETNPFGFTAAKDPFHVHDFHATALHLMGIEHKKLTYKYKRRNFRLTDVHGHVVKKVLA